jgi:hypothetical protein
VIRDLKMSWYKSTVVTCWCDCFLTASRPTCQQYQCDTCKMWGSLTAVLLKIRVLWDGMLYQVCSSHTIIRKITDDYSLSDTATHSTGFVSSLYPLFNFQPAIPYSSGSTVS